MRSSFEFFKKADFATWLNTFVTIVGILLPLLTWFASKGYFFEVTSAVELGIIFYLLFLQRIKSRNLIPFERRSQTGFFGDDVLFNLFYLSETEKIKGRFNALNNGYLKLYGAEVRYFQVRLMDFLVQNREGSLVYATDITNNPGILLSRDDYMQQNRLFIQAGGRIRRVLIVDEKKLLRGDFLSDLYQVIELNRKCGVDIGLYLMSLLDSNERQDFIIYDKFSVIVEGKQADETYDVASSTIFFTKFEVESYSNIFNKIWDENLQYSSKRILEEFYEFSEECIKQGNWSYFSAQRFTNKILKIKKID
ncbi:hypothetical protein N836_07195 [Leptolyngbya sp. Heron Island J]|uniref:hypothetical protein n=1 Tax=Leptolyngbya sp. Heron Island J TaxID=1385935 RepID=UPI0003B9B988|nr:hypothetical protein [Leptolyngbya sp. Heron Island J]ESA36552.1 hypothetical protein N836_07195 [Leptolyngbya sp. Heron Island J]